MQRQGVDAFSWDLGTFIPQRENIDRFYFVPLAPLPP